MKDLRRLVGLLKISQDQHFLRSFLHHLFTTSPILRYLWQNRWLLELLQIFVFRDKALKNRWVLIRTKTTSTLAWVLLIPILIVLEFHARELPWHLRHEWFFHFELPGGWVVKVNLVSVHWITIVKWFAALDVRMICRRLVRLVSATGFFRWRLWILQRYRSCGILLRTLQNK